MLGIIIGIAAIISIVSTIKGTNEEIKNSLIGAGNNAVNIQINQQGYPLTIYSSSDVPFGIPEVTEETKQAILDLDSVENMTSYKERQSPDSIFYQDKAMDISTDITVLETMLAQEGLTEKDFNTGGK